MFFWILSLALLGTGCSGNQGAAENKEEAGHEESPSGASFKAGKGVALTDETRKILNVEIADVAEENLPQVVRFNAQVFADRTHTGYDLHGSGFLPAEKAAFLKPKQPVRLTAGNEILEGFVVGIQKALAHGENEVIVGITSVGTKIRDGEFVTVVVVLPREKPVTVVPSSSILETAEGTFVYAVNEASYYRTAVKTGSENEGKTEIVDGLYLGDQVVTKPVETLWLIELRATKGGGHSH